MPSPNSTAAYNVAVFLAWTVTSFLCHFCAKAFLLSVAETGQSAKVDLGWHVFYAGVLTLVQTGLCYMAVGMKPTKDNKSLLVARLTHVLATFSTNFSLALMFASSTLAVKLMEPITSAVIQFCLQRTAMSPVTALSLPMIVGGAITFSGNPVSDIKLSMGFGAAFLSNIVLAFRNLAIKKIDSGPQGAMKLKVQTPQLFVLLPVLLGGSIMLLYLEKVHSLHRQTLYALAMCSMSGVFHVAYSYVSTGLVLTQLSVVSHAVANIMKRVLVVLLLYLVGGRIATPYNFFGLATCTFGLLLYAWDKQTTSSNRATHNGERFNKSHKVPCFYLLVVPFCFIAVWGAMQVFPNAHFHSYSETFFVRRFLEESQPDRSSLEPAMFQNQEGKMKMSNFFDHSFGPRSSKRPDDWQLLPDLMDFPAAKRASIKKFLKLHLINNSVESSYLSMKLKTSQEVIKEAQRIHYNMFEDAIGRYKYCILLDTADFENKGDPAITVGEIYFITRLGIELVYYCNNVALKNNKLDLAISIASTYSPDELVILLHGGGNINAYFQHDDLRRDIFNKFRGFQFFLFPQSFLVKNITSEHFKQCIASYCCNENLTFVLRDQQSYSSAKKYFNGTTRLLVAPDMAFHIGPFKRIMSPVFDILWIKRSDAETPGYDTVPQHPPHLRLHVSDWIKFRTPKARTSLEKSIYTTVMGMFYIQRGRVVITDRLHGHILCILLDIPHVLLDNQAKKLSSYYNSWTKGLVKTRITDSPDKALKLALELLKIYGDREIPPRAPWINISETLQDINYSLPEMDFP